MPRFAANLTLLFNELPFMERFAAAAEAGFGAVEFMFPYAHAPGEIAAELRRHNLQSIAFNLPPGDFAAGERGIACLPGREQEFQEGLQQAIQYAKACGTRCLHVMAGLLPPGADPMRHRAVYLDNLGLAAAEAAGLSRLAVGHRRERGDWVGEARFVPSFESLTDVLAQLGFSDRNQS